MQSLAVKNQGSIESKLNFFASFGYFPHEEQLRAHYAMTQFRFVTVAAGARGGKSMLGGAEIMYMFCQPFKHIWCVSSQYNLADKEFDWFLHFAAYCKIGGKSVKDWCKISSPEAWIVTGKHTRCV